MIESRSVAIEMRVKRKEDIDLELAWREISRIMGMIQILAEMVVI